MKTAAGLDNIKETLLNGVSHRGKYSLDIKYALEELAENYPEFKNKAKLIQTDMAVLNKTPIAHQGVLIRDINRDLQSLAGSFGKTAFYNKLVKLGSTNPELRPHIRPLLKAASNGPYEIEGSDFAVKIWDRQPHATFELYHPIANAGRPGKTVSVTTFIWYYTNRNSAWGYEGKLALQKAKDVVDAVYALEEIQEEMKASDPNVTVLSQKETRRGVDVELPTSMHIKNIDGVDIHVNLNSNPITITSDSLSESLEDGHMTYWWRVNPVYKKTLMAIAPLLESARNNIVAMKILDQNGVRYEYHSHMQSGWDSVMPLNVL